MEGEKLAEESGMGPGEEIKLMDEVQVQSNKDIGSLLPCDPCLDAIADGVDAPEEAEPVDIGLGIEDELFEF